MSKTSTQILTKHQKELLKQFLEVMENKDEARSLLPSLRVFSSALPLRLM